MEKSKDGRLERWKSADSKWVVGRVLGVMSMNPLVELTPEILT